MRHAVWGWAGRFDDRLHERGIETTGWDEKTAPPNLMLEAFGPKGRTYFCIFAAGGMDRELAWGRWTRTENVRIAIDPDSLTNAQAAADTVADAILSGEYTSLGDRR